MFIVDDKLVISDEFLLDWMECYLGLLLEVVIFFYYLDVDRNGYIEDIDIFWIFVFFDRNSIIFKIFFC